MVTDGRYLAAKTVSDVWICYPWEATYVFLANCPIPPPPPKRKPHLFLLLSLPCPQFHVLIPLTSSRDIDEHDKLAASQRANY